MTATFTLSWSFVMEASLHTCPASKPTLSKKYPRSCSRCWQLSANATPVGSCIETSSLVSSVILVYTASNSQRETQEIKLAFLEDQSCETHICSHCRMWRACYLRSDQVMRLILVKKYLRYFKAPYLVWRRPWSWSTVNKPRSWSETSQMTTHSSSWVHGQG